MSVHDPKSVALSILIAILVTGLGAWFAFGNETASKAELEKHARKPSHQEQQVENAKTQARLKRIEEKLVEVRKRQEEMPKRVAREVVEALKK